MNISALIAGLFSGLIGAMGLGGGGVLIIYLKLWTETGQLKAQGMNLLFFIPIAVTAVTVYTVKKQIQWKLDGKIILWGLLGTGVGLLLTGLLGGKLIAKAFGAGLAVLGIKELLTKSKKTVAERKKK